MRKYGKYFQVSNNHTLLNDKRKSQMAVYFSKNEYSVIHISITKAKTRVANEQNRPTDGHRYSSEVPKPIVGGAASVVLSVQGV